VTSQRIREVLGHEYMCPKSICSSPQIIDAFEGLESGPEYSAVTERGKNSLRVLRASGDEAQPGH